MWTDRRAFLAGAAAACLMPIAQSLAATGQNATPRVISLDYGIATTLLALGVTPIGVASADRWDRWVREPVLPESVVDIGQDLAINLELVARLQPDLILMTPYTLSLRPALERIAPVQVVTLYAEGGSPLVRARQETRRLAGLIDRQPAADHYLSAFEERLDAARARASRLSPPPVALVNFMDARHARIYGANSLYQDILDRIGLENVWKKPTNYWGFSTIGLEELARDAGGDMALVVFEPLVEEIKPTLARSPLWKDLPVVREERFAILPPVLMFGMLPSAERFLTLLLDHLEARYG